MTVQRLAFYAFVFFLGFAAASAQDTREDAPDRAELATIALDTAWAELGKEVDRGALPDLPPPSR